MPKQPAPPPKPNVPTENYFTASGVRFAVKEVPSQRLNEALDFVTDEQERAWVLGEIMARSFRLALKRSELEGSGHTVSEIEGGQSFMAYGPDGTALLAAPAPTAQDAWRRLVQTLGA